MKGEERSGGGVVHRVTCVATKRIPRAVCMGNRQWTRFLFTQPTLFAPSRRRPSGV